VTTPSYGGSAGESETLQWRVVVNLEEQYSLLRTHISNPDGWRDEGFSGSKSECLAHIEEVWTDMRPLSVRQRSE